MASTIREMQTIAQLKLTRSSDQVTFGRLLTLLSALWENFGSSFVKEINFLQAIGINKQDTATLLKRIDGRYLDKEQEEPVGKLRATILLTTSHSLLLTIDDEVMALYLSLTEKILLDSEALEETDRIESIKQHYDTCLDLLKYRPTSKRDPRCYHECYHQLSLLFSLERQS